MSDERLAEVLRHLQPEPGTKLWHGGATALGALRGVSAQTAAWRPSPDRHSIWDLTLHVAYWNYAVRRRITDAPRGGFPRSPANWPAPPSEMLPAAWKADRAVARDARDLLIQAVEAFDPARMDEPVGPDSDTTFARLLFGIILHDTYHAGQIQLLKGLHSEMSGR